MKKSDFEDSPSGKLIPTERNQWAFVPDPLPPAQVELELLANALERASRLLGELNGITRILPNPYLLIGPLQTREALSSSSMEGTYSTADAVLLAEAGGEIRDGMSEAREVVNYRKALSEAISSFEHLPLSLRTIRNAHKTLLQGVNKHRGRTANPGEFKTTQNFIGVQKIENARFIPPPPRQALEALHDLETYMHDENRDYLPDLVESALIHYQFETIHPFGDGNGRVGRMLITLDLLSRGVISSPILYLSPSLEKRKDEYIDLMFEVSRSGQWSNWIGFFLEIVCDACESTIETCQKLYQLQQYYRDRVMKVGRSGNLVKAVDFLFDAPFITIPNLQRHLGVTYRSAQLNVETMVKAGILRELAGISNPKYFVAIDILHIISGAEDNENA